MKPLCCLLLFTYGLALIGCSKGPTLSVYCWAGDIDPKVLEEFESRHHCKVAIEHFASNEELFAKLKNINTSRQIYDVLFPSDYMVSILISEKLLEELPPKDALSNWKHVNPSYANLYFDRGNHYSVPYQFGLTGMAWDSNRIQLQGKEVSWQLFLDNKFKGKTSLLNDSREAFSVAFKLLGRSVNETDPSWLEKAALKLRQMKHIAAAINSENFEYLILNGDVLIAHAWNTNILKLKAQHPTLQFALPKEGGVIWMDNLAIPKGAKHKDLAVAFINFFLDPETAKKNALFSQQATPNRTASQMLPKELATNPNLYPTQRELRKRLEWIRDLGPEVTANYENLWTRVKGQ